MSVMTYVVAALVAVSVFQTWCLWRVLIRLGVLGRFEERISSLTHTVMLLTDTTETCFQTVAGQLELEQSQRGIAPISRVARQKRVVVAARRGRSVTEIAADEELAESEVRLRLHLAEQDAPAKRGRHGSMHA